MGGRSPGEAGSPRGGRARGIPVDEREIRLEIAVLPGDVRDFRLVRIPPEGPPEPLGLARLLALDRAADLIVRVGRQRPDLALVLALGRLLVPCLAFRGSDRHLVVEPWGGTDLRGETIVPDVRTDFARELAAEQAWQARAVEGGARPDGSLAALFWEAHAELPPLPDEFDDPDLGRLAKALYLQLVPEGTEQSDHDYKVVAARLRDLRRADFAPLRLGIGKRRLRTLFRKLLAVAVRHAGQLAGVAAVELVLGRLDPGLPGPTADEIERPDADRSNADPSATTAPPTAAESALLEVRYGAVKELGDIHLGLLAGSGPGLAGLVDDYARAVAGVAGAPSRELAVEGLRASIALLAGFRRRRKDARAQERREDREHHPKRTPPGPRLPAQGQADPRAFDPGTDAARREEMQGLRAILSGLKPRDRRLIEALIDSGGDRRAAAAELGITLKIFSRRLRQTVRPNARKAADRGRKDG